MKKTQLNMIIIEDFEGKKARMEKVDGYEFSINGIKLVVHKHKPHIETGYCRGWTTSEPTTGTAFNPHPYSSRKKAILEAKSLFESVGIEKVSQAVEKAKKTISQFNIA